MKICILTTTFPRYRQDTLPQFVFGLARSLVEANAEVLVIAPHDHETVSHAWMDGVEIRRFHYWWPQTAHGLCYGAGIPTNVRRRKWVAVQLPTLEAGFLSAALQYAGDCDVLDAHWTFAGVAAVVASKLRHKPLVTHAYSAEYVPKALRPVNRFIVKHSQAVVSNSTFTAKIVQQVAKPQYQEVIASGVNAEKIAPADFDVAGFRKDKNIPDEAFFVFAVGRLVERKGYPFLLDAIGKLVQRGKYIRLILGGSGPLKDALMAKIDAEGLSQHVMMPGFIPENELPAYLRAADVLVMPSIPDETGDTEGLGIPLLEAMANGTPVIASATGGILDIVQDGQNGLLVAPCDADAIALALTTLMDEPAKRQHLIENGTRSVQTTFSWQTIAQRTLDVYTSAAQRHKGKP